MSTTEVHIQHCFVAMLIEPQVLHEFMPEQIAFIKQGSGSTVQLGEFKYEHQCKQKFDVQN